MKYAFNLGSSLLIRKPLLDSYSSLWRSIYVSFFLFVIWLYNLGADI